MTSTAPPASIAPASAATLEVALRRALSGEVAFDRYSRRLFATDASMYAIEPVGVVFPRDRSDVQAAVRLCGEFGVAVLPRGAGTSLAGQTVGRAVVLDMSRHMTEILEIDPEARTARVQPGVVQDDLNRAAAKHGLLFAPDTSTSNRATLGGMIGNNSCGARSARYGMTIDHVVALDVVLADGSLAHLGPVSEDEAARRGVGRADRATRGTSEGSRGTSEGTRGTSEGMAEDTPERTAEGAGGAGADAGSGDRTLEASLYRAIPGLVRDHADVIRAALPPHWRRSGGYRLERLLPEAGPLNLAHLVVGSEGTLAVTTEATVRLVPKPGAIAALVGHFETVDAAIEAAPSALEAGATTVELVDKMILDLARRSPVHRHLPKLLDGDPGAILWVEFYGDGAPESAAASATEAMEGLRARWAAEGHGYAVLAAPTPERQEGFRQLRKAGLGLLMSAGQAGERSLAFVEDTAVAPERLAEYTRRFAGILEAHGLRAGFYGHASAGCLHVRPFMDLARPGAADTMRAVAVEVLALVQEFGGMNASEHGDGLARGEFNRRFFGDEFYELMRVVKRTFDPRGILNPGKKVDVGPMTEHLRDAALPPAPELRTWFAYGGQAAERADVRTGGDAATAATMRREADKCARVGACRKGAAAGGVMCPSYMATRQEEHATRGRANALVAALSEADPKAALADDRLHEILDLCLECKACKVECPLHVDMATLKSEALAHRYERTGVPLRARLFGNVRTLNQWGAALAPFSNWPGRLGPLRWLLEKTVGIDARRPLPTFQRETLPRWFARTRGSGVDGRGQEGSLASGALVHTPSPTAAAPVRSGPHPPPAASGGAAVPSLTAAATSPARTSASGTRPTRGPLLFLADSFTSYTEPHIGRAAVELLEMAGWQVHLVGDVCCGRSLVSKGMLAQARDRHRHLLGRLGGPARAGVPIVGVEPSCLLTLADEVPDLAAGSGMPEEADAARAVAGRVRLVDDLLAEALDDGSLVLDPDADVTGRTILFHGHCHQKAGGAMAGSIQLLRAIPGADVQVLDAGCCGMAGSFGFEAEHYDLSMTIAGQRLVPAVRGAPADALVAATGVSCRQQIFHGTGRTARHPVELVREAVR